MRLMRLIVMFDIPNSSPSLRRQYSLFRKHLIADGFLMEQFSVYSRLVATREACAGFIARMRAVQPDAGRITVFELTEKQYARRRELVNKSYARTPADLDTGQLSLFL